MGDRLKEKVALVSGAGSSSPGWGNGKATAVLFAREGAKVLAADINLAAALETKRIIEAEGGICETVCGDVSRAGDVAGARYVPRDCLTDAALAPNDPFGLDGGIEIDVGGKDLCSLAGEEHRRCLAVAPARATRARP